MAELEFDDDEEAEEEEDEEVRSGSLCGTDSCAIVPDHSLTRVAGWHRTRKASRNTKFVIATVRGRRS